MKHREKINIINRPLEHKKRYKRQSFTLPIIALAGVLAFLVYDFINRGKTNTPTKNNPEYAQISNLIPEIPEESVDSTFKMKQMRFSRYIKAHDQKIDSLKTLLKKQGIENPAIELYLRVFKKEQIIEVWVREKTKSPKFSLLTTYAFCATSGGLGPKLKEGDKQIPEGFYHIDRFNPGSNYHLSLGINYPNRADEIIGDTINLGGDIFIHGGCETVGCIPITDDKIKELYVLAVEAKEAGQKKIPISIFPTKLDDATFLQLKAEFEGNIKLIAFWKTLKTGYDYFENCHELPTIKITEAGKYVISDKCPN